MLFRKLSILLNFIFLSIFSLQAQVHMKYGLSTTVGDITTSFRSNDTLFVAGTFPRIGYSCGSMARYKNNQRDVLDESIPYITGSINALEPDGSGGWFVAGAINYAGQTWGPLTHILADGAVDLNFQFVVQGNNLIHCMKLHDGSLYVGGNFSIVNSTQVRYVVKVDAINGMVDATWNPAIQDNQYGEIKDIAIYQNKVIIAGYYTQSGSQPANSLAAFSTGNGALGINFNTSGSVYKIKVESDTLWAVGEFSNMLGSTVSNIAKINLADTSLVSNFLTTQINSRILAFDIAPDAVYIGGNFSVVNGVSRGGLAKLNRKTGAVDPGFQVNLGGLPLVNVLSVHGNNLIIGGPFTETGGAYRRNLAELNRLTGALSSWNPSVESSANGVISQGNDLIIYGAMSFIGVEERTAFAAIKLSTRKILPLKITLTSFNPTIYSMARNGNKLYLTGIFTQINGTAVSSPIAEVNLSNGAVQAIPVSVNNSINVLGVFQNRLYFLGPFTEVNGQTRQQAASIDLPSFSLNNWDPKVFGFNFRQIEGRGDKLFLCGGISGIGTENQYGIAAVDPVTGANTDFKPNVSGNSVRRMLFDGNKIYLAGDFSMVGQQSRKGLALLNEDGTLVPQFEVANNGSVDLHHQIALMNGNLIAARDTQAGNANMRFRAYDALSGQLTATLPLRMTRANQFSPLPNCTGIYPVDSVLVVAGAFDRVNGLNINSLAFVDFRATEPAQLVSQIFPNKSAPVEGAEFYIYGKGFTPNPAVKFSKSGQPDVNIPANSIEYIDPYTIRVKTNLIGWQLGLWQVTVTLDNSIVLNMPGGLTIEHEKPYNLEIFISGPQFLGRNDYPYYHLYFRNTGNVPAYGVPFFYAASPHATLSPVGPLSGNILTQIVEEPFDRDIFPANTFQTYYQKTSASGDPFHVYPYYLPFLKGYGSGKITVAINSPQLGDINLVGWALKPWLIKDKVNPQVIHAINKIIKATPGGSGSSSQNAGTSLKGAVNSAASSSGSGSSVPSGSTGGGSVGGGGSGGGTSAARIMIYETDMVGTWAINEAAGNAGVSNPTSYGPEFAQAMMDELLPDESWDPFCGDCFPEDPEKYANPESDTTDYAADSTDHPGIADKSTGIKLSVLASKDPNAKYGPQGILGNRHLNALKPLPYIITFENDPEATAPARLVVIRDTLDKDVFDLSSFNLGDISFGKYSIFIPPGLKIYRNRIDLNPGFNKWVDVDARLNESSGVFTLTLRSIDPVTGVMPVNPLDGFLPANNEARDGEGSVSFFLSLKENLSDGVPVSNRASIIFDDNDPIQTNTYTNILDRVKPESSISTIEGDGPEYTLSGSGSDEGSGIYAYAVYGRVNDGIWKELRRNMADLNHDLNLSTDSIYQFVSLAIDSAGNLEAWPEIPDLTFPSTGLDDLMQNQLLEVFPNPSNGILNIRHAGSAKINRLELFDMQGRNVLLQAAAGNQTETLNLATLGKGIYTLIVHLNDHSRLVQVVQKY